MFYKFVDYRSVFVLAHFALSRGAVGQDLAGPFVRRGAWPNGVHMAYVIWPLYLGLSTEHSRFTQLRSQKALRQRAAMPANSKKNVDAKVARGFGKEWSTFRQDEHSLSREQRETIFENYFRIFPWNLLPPGGGVGIDVGCGTGRWSMSVAPRVAHLHLLDASPEALAVAKDNLKAHDECQLSCQQC